MKISKLILACALGVFMSNVYAENTYYYVFCTHITADTEKAYFSPVKTINKSRDDIDTTELGKVFALSINQSGKTVCHGYESDKSGDDGEAIEGREKGINFLRNKGVSVRNSDMQDFSDYVKSLND